MRYACLIYDNETEMNAAMQKEGDKIMGEYFAFTQDVQKTGHYHAGEALQPVATATTLRIRNGKLQTTDGPFAETKEQLGGLYLIDAKDLNEAIQIASRIPSCRYGSVEVRPVIDFSQGGTM
ncbi:MAG: YciI family protein [Gemmatimonadetes bacterium]|nr:YciI family protein [Gemmatimonadota bacterium]